MQAIPSRRANAVFGLIVVACAVYLAGLIWGTSFVVGSVRYFCLFDDAMISMRYARNLAEGFGAVWNPGGERVEGYTNPLWMLYMAVLHFLPVPPAKICLLVQVSSALLLLANLFFVRRIGEAVSGGDPWIALGGVVLTAFYLPLNNWAIQGMEVGLAACLLSCAVAQAVQPAGAGRFPWIVYGCLGLGLLVRMDLAVPLVLIGTWLVWSDPAQRRRHALATAVALMVGLGAPTLVRLLYYGDLLPNTYHLKMTGYPVLLRIARGALVLWDFARNSGSVFLLLPWIAAGVRRDKRIVFLLAVLAGQLAYSVYVGGDAWEWWGGANRYIAVAMPLFFVAFCWSLGEIAKQIITVPEKSSPLRRSWPVPLATAMGLVLFNLPRIMSAALVQPLLEVRGNERMVEYAVCLQECTRPEARVAVVWAGIIPYFADRQMLDLMGKCDRHVGRMQAHRATAGSELRYFYPGHVKWDYAYSLGELKPDVVLQAWDREASPAVTIEAARPYLGDDYREMKWRDFTFFVRRSSTNVVWERLEELPAAAGR